VAIRITDPDTVRIRIATLVRRALAQVGTLPVLPIIVAIVVIIPA